MIQKNWLENHSVIYTKQDKPGSFVIYVFVCNPKAADNSVPSPVTAGDEGHVKEPERMIEIADSCDVLVVGGVFGCIC